MRRVAVFVTLIVVALAMSALPAVAAGGARSAGAAEAYIVVLKSGDPGKAAAEHGRRHGASVKHVYRHALRGYAARMSAEAAAAIARNPRVAYVEPDGVVTASTTQADATWGLDRVDARSGLDKMYSYTATGLGVTAYIVDTGIRRTHSDFGGRADAVGFDAIGDGRNGDDCNGHGTHVAGTVGGTTWGVAKAVTLVPVRVLDCNGSGTWSGVIAGLDWVASNHVDGAPAVANMSLGGGASDSVDAAVQRVIDDGVTVAVAAGNGNQAGREQDACNYSPARVPAAITIGATTQSDSKTSWSNYGSCVDWFAPGAGITSAWHTSDSATNTISGTSMATPHTAGAAALHLEGDAGATPAAVRTALYDATTKGIVTSSRTANNHLLYTGPVTNAAPTASFTYQCTDLTCSFDASGSTDSDGTISSYSWDFGDGATGTGSTTSHTYAAGATYIVTLTVTDEDAATDDEIKTVTVPAPSSSAITLTAAGYKVKGFQHVDLTWSGATSSSVDVFRGTTKIATTDNDGAYTDSLNKKGSGSYTYRVCEAETSTCSNDATVTF